MIFVITMAAGLVLALMTFKVCLDMDAAWYWAVLVALIPLAATFFFGIIGIIVAAAFVAAVYRAGG